MIFVVMVTGSTCVPIRKAIALNTDEFPNSLNTRRVDADSDATKFQTAITNELKTVQKRVLSVIEDNARIILELEKPAREAIRQFLSDGDCAYNLRKVLNSVTKFTNFKSSNCVRSYEGSIDTEVRLRNNQIKSCMKEIQESVTFAYHVITNRVQTCIAFERSQTMQYINIKPPNRR